MEPKPKPKELINIYQDLKNKYRNYDTRDALRRMQAFRKSLVKLGEKGFSVGLELLGSLNFGIVESNSDADLIVLHYCESHRQGGECMPHCSNLSFERDAIAQVLAEHLQIAHFHIETIDCINLHYIDECTKAERELDTKDEMMLRFLFYCTIGRPVNRMLFSEYYKKLSQNTEIMQYFHTWASEALRSYLNTPGHRFSFQKYNERIQSRGLQLPQGLRQELEYYLD